MATLPSLNPVFAPFSAATKRQLDIEAGLKFRAEFGSAPVGAEVLSSDRCETEYGDYEIIEFFIIPDEAVLPLLTVTEVVGFDTLVHWLATGDEQSVVNLTISFGNGDFLATGWYRTAEALPMVMKIARGEF